MSAPGSDLKQAVRRKGSLLHTMRAIAWAFFGVRKGSEYEKDVSQLNPVHVIIAGLIGALLFIAVLVGIVRWVIASGIAA